MSLGTKMKMRLPARIKMRLLALCLLTAAVLSRAALAAAPIVVTTGGHAAFARAVFDCPQLTGYRVTQTGNVLRVRLSTPADAKIIAAQTDQIKKITAVRQGSDALDIDISTVANATYKDFRWNDKIIIDVYAPKNAPVKAAQAAEDMPFAQGNALKAPVKAAQAAEDMPFAQGNAPAMKATPPEKDLSAAKEEEKETAKEQALQRKPEMPPISLTPKKSVTISTAEKVRRAEEKVKALIESLAGGKKQEKKNEKHAGPVVRAEPVAPVDTGPILSDPEAIAAAGLPGHQKSLLPIWNLSITKPDGGVIPAAVPDASVQTPPLLPPGSSDRTATITVSSLAPLRIAVFHRAGGLWIVTDATGVDASPPAVSGAMAPMIPAPQVMRLAHGTAYRYTLPGDLYYPIVSQKNLLWKILLLPYQPPPSLAPLSATLRVETEPKTHEALLAAYLRGAGEPLTVTDPAVGDKMYVVPTNLAGEAVSDARHMPDLDVIPAVTGMVVQPLKDGIKVRRIQLTDAAANDNKGSQTGADPLADAAGEPYNHVIVVTAPYGLAVTPNGAVLRLVGTPTAAENDDARRLFDFPNWRRGGIKKLFENESKLTERVAKATSQDERLGRLMDLAKLYFANDFGPEALAVLDLVKQENPHIVENPDFLSLRGAARAEAGHYNGALDDLSNPLVRSSPEANLWIGYAAAATEQWREAERDFPKSNRLLLQYPDNLAIPFTIYMAEAALHLGHTAQANKLLASINQTSSALDPHYRAAIDYLRGISYAQQGEPEKAETLWVPVADGLDSLYHTKASLSLARLLLQEKKITLQDAIDRVDSLRFAWRGDGLEVDILHTLGALKVQNGQILSGMEDMKQAAALSMRLNDDPSPITDDMQRVFVDLFTSNDKGKVQPLQLVALYNEFSNLTPPGAEGTTVTLNYIDDLINIDLLDQAASQMQNLLQNGNLPESLAAAVGVKLTAVYLLDSKPKEALLALAQSARAGLPRHIMIERELLKARALSQMGKTDAAIAVLKNMHSEDAERLKANVLWRANRWADAAAALEPLLPDPLSHLTDKQATYVLNDAVAWKLAQDTGKLEALKEKYQAAMAKTKLAATFDVVTRNGGDSALGDREQMLKIAGEVDMFKDFLDSYKAGLGGSGS